MTNPLGDASAVGSERFERSSVCKADCGRQVKITGEERGRFFPGCCNFHHLFGGFIRQQRKNAVIAAHEKMSLQFQRHVTKASAAAASYCHQVNAAFRVFGKSMAENIGGLSEIKRRHEVGDLGNRCSGEPTKQCAAQRSSVMVFKAEISRQRYDGHPWS